MTCWRTAPTAVSEASVMMQVRAEDLGWLRRVTCALWWPPLSKPVVVTEVLLPEKRLVVAVFAQWGTKR